MPPVWIRTGFVMLRMIAQHREFLLAVPGIFQGCQPGNTTPKGEPFEAQELLPDTF